MYPSSSLIEQQKQKQEGFWNRKEWARGGGIGIGIMHSLARVKLKEEKMCVFVCASVRPCPVQSSSVRICKDLVVSKTLYILLSSVLVLVHADCCLQRCPGQLLVY